MFGGGQDERAHVAVGRAERGMQAVTFQGGLGDRALHADGDVLERWRSAVVASHAEQVFHLGLAGDEQGVNLVSVEGGEQPQDRRRIDRPIPDVRGKLEDVGAARAQRLAQLGIGLTVELQGDDLAAQVDFLRGRPALRRWCSAAGR